MWTRATLKVSCEGSRWLVARWAVISTAASGVRFAIRASRWSAVEPATPEGVGLSVGLAEPVLKGF